MSKRVLVTGGAGFIGSHVAEAYLADGWEVTVLDDLSRGKEHNIPAGASFVQADIRSPEARERQKVLEAIDNQIAAAKADANREPFELRGDG